MSAQMRINEEAKQTLEHYQMEVKLNKGYKLSKTAVILYMADTIQALRSENATLSVTVEEQKETIKALSSLLDDASAPF